jgi:Ca2+-binding RTX toxin-like protein
MKLRAVLILATVVLGGMLLSGVALAVTKYGDADPNKLMGTNNTDYIYGGDGGDEIGGKNGDDWLYGDNGSDRLHSGYGDDNIKGGNGHDLGWGDEGVDHLWSVIDQQKHKGGPHKDDESLTDVLKGGPGNDTIVANNDMKDRVECGTGGDDTAYVDENLDIVVNEGNCETLYLCPPDPSGEEPCATPPEPPARLYSRRG